MLVLADDAARARLVIAATAVPRRARSRWLRNLARTTAPRIGGPRHARASAVMQRGSAQGFYGT